MAQAPFYQEITGSHLPVQFGGVCMDASAGDADGDGDPDLALAMEFQTNILLLNDGAGNFTDASDRLPRTTHDSEDVVFADFDNDGDLDILVANEGQNQLFINNSGILVDATTSNLPARNDETREIRAVDVDGDDDLDLLVANVSFTMVESAQEYLLLNDGSGRFTAAAPGTVLPAEADGNGFDIEVADFDADGITDLFLCNRASVADAPLVSGGLQRLLRGVPDPD